MVDSTRSAGATPPPTGGAAAGPGAMDPIAMMRTKQYVGAVVLAALLGLPISAIAYGFLVAVATIQRFIFETLPTELLGGSPPAWWPLPWLMLSGLLTAVAIRYLPGHGGHSPAFGFTAGGGPTTGGELLGVASAALATLALGAVLGPEAPLIAIGSGLGAVVVRRLRSGAPPAVITVMASAGSFAAVSTLFGSPILAAFLIMEVAGIGGATLTLVALPGLVASGLGALVFVGLGSWSGLGTFSLTLPAVPAPSAPTAADLLWALVLGAIAAIIGWMIRSAALSLRPLVHQNRILVTTGFGLAIGVIAMLYQLISGRSFTDVLFSGQTALPALLKSASDFSVGLLIALLVCKAVVYAISLSAFRGGPVFPALFIGGALGLAVSGAPGMDLTSALAIGLGGMAAAMLRLPLTATLLATVLLGVDNVQITPIVIVAVATSFLITNLLPVPKSEPSPEAAGSAKP
jgi:chloride channel protein, CIC family